MMFYKHKFTWAPVLTEISSAERLNLSFFVPGHTQYQDFWSRDRGCRGHALDQLKTNQDAKVCSTIILRRREENPTQSACQIWETCSA